MGQGISLKGVWEIFIRRWLFIAFIILVISWPVLLNSCGGGGGSSGGGHTAIGELTAINDTTQGSQAAVITLSEVDNLSQGYNQLANLVTQGASSPQPASITIIRTTAFPAKDGLRFFTSLKKFSSKLGTLHMVRALNVSDMTCADGGSMSYDDLGDSLPDTYRVTFNLCRDAGLEQHGIVEKTCSDGQCSTTTLSFGASGNPYIETYYKNDTATPEYDYITKSDEFKAISTLGLESTGTINEINSTLTGNGYIEYYLYYPGTPDVDKERLDMTDFRLDVHYISGSSSYSYNIIANGSWGYSYAYNGNPVFSTATSFSDLNYLLEDVFTSYYSIAINGLFTVNLYPDNACLEGTFNVITNIPIKYDYAYTRTVEGQLTFNGNTVVVYNFDGTITVTVNGQSVSYGNINELYNLCPSI